MWNESEDIVSYKCRIYYTHFCKERKKNNFRSICPQKSFQMICVCVDCTTLTPILATCEIIQMFWFHGQVSAFAAILLYQRFSMVALAYSYRACPRHFASCGKGLFGACTHIPKYHAQKPTRQAVEFYFSIGNGTASSTIPEDSRVIWEHRASL